MRDTNCHLPRLWPFVFGGGKNTPFAKSSPPAPVQSKAVPGKRAARQWKLMPGGQRKGRGEEGVGGGGAVSSAKLPVCVTLPTPSIVFGPCHLSLSTYGCGKRADVQPWHFVGASRRDVAVARQQEEAPHCAQTNSFGRAQPHSCACVKLCAHLGGRCT